MIPDNQPGEAAEEEVNHREMMPITRDSPDNTIESRKKRTVIKIIVDPIVHFDFCKSSALLRDVDFFEACEICPDDIEHTFLIR
jgi:hypothetical protein